MKKLMWLCDMGGSFINRDGDYIRQDVMETLTAFKAEGDVIAMATDGDRRYAENIERRIARQQPDGATPFDMCLHSSTFYAEKIEQHYWQGLVKTFGDNHIFALLDDRADIRARAAEYGVLGVDMAPGLPSASIIASVETTRQTAIQSLTA